MTKILENAVLYLRSSKDRSDVSIDAQRRQLLDVAEKKGFYVMQEFTDVVESAKSENRPGFQSLLNEMRDPMRQWSKILILDHSRLSRQQYVGPLFSHDAQRLGIEVIYAMMPDMPPTMRILSDSVFDAFSVIHSINSKEKGLAGMKENIRRGFRAGGRAPRGYELDHIDTGVVRDGLPVTKSRLIPNAEASLISRYLNAIANGMPRAKAVKDFEIPWPSSSLIDLEWNALTYAGHTVWNVRAEKDPKGGYKGGKKRKPRSEWIIQEGTHKALITTEAAECILNRLESGKIGKAVSAAKSGASNYLLTGILKSTDGRDWSGNAQKHYRIKPDGDSKGRWLPMNLVDVAITDKILEDLNSPKFIGGILSKIQDINSKVQDDGTKPLKKQQYAIDKMISKATDLALELAEPGPMLRRIEELDQQRKQIVNEITRLEKEQKPSSVLANVTEQQVKSAVNEVVKNFELLPRENWKKLIQAITARIELDPVSLDCRIHYRIPVKKNRTTLGTPWGRHFIPTTDGDPIMDRAVERVWIQAHAIY